MSLYSYQYAQPETPIQNSNKRLYFLFGLTVGLFLFVILLPLSLLIPSSPSIVSPISANAQINVGNENQEKAKIPVSNDPSTSSGQAWEPTGLPSEASAKDGVRNTGIELLTNLLPTPFFKPSKSSYSIAVYGDSMVDTMGERLEYLEHALKKKYPDVNFTLYNFGKGAENVEMGLSRFGSELHYQDRNYPSLPQIMPDIIIIGSFAYNPFTPHDRDRHWLGLTHLVQEAKNLTSQVYLLAEIAPLRKDFGKGPNGVNWDDQTNFEHSGRIIEQLENAVGLSKTLHIPIIDVYHESLANATEGKREYVNPGDGIHPNIAGHEYMAEKIVETIQLK